jgi:CDP-4-dehydro-6-deoxyglucose reductase
VIHRLSLARAAHLVGVHRSALQRMIREGTLAADEGMVSTEELLRVFPEAPIGVEAGLERLARIKEESFGRRVQERTLPSQEVLAQRLFGQSRELADLRRLVQRYHALIESVDARLARDFAGHPALEDMRAQLTEGLGALFAAEGADPIAVMDDFARVLTPNVRLRPSGREFFVEGRDTVLEAGLKAGIRLGYGCGNGTCGLCKARVTSGQVQRVKPHDYPLSEAERAQGHVLMCAYAPVTDVELETLEAQGPQDIPVQTVVAKVREVKPLSADTLLLHLQTARSSRLRFLAGQCARLGAALATGDVGGTYPIASCPCDDRNLLFHIGRDPHDGLAVNLFGGTIRAGESLTVTGPDGRFVLRETRGAGATFLCCDLGFAPVKSLVEYALSADAAESYAVLWLATRADGHYLANQCRSWAEALDDFRFLPVAHADPAQGATALVEAARGAMDLATRDLYVAGPEAFVQAAEFELRSAGVSPDRMSLLAV